MVEKEYLKELIKKVNDLRKETKFEKIDIGSCSIVYLPIKKQNLSCLFEGLSTQYRRQLKNIKYQDKIRANCKNYLKIYKDKQSKIVFIESIHEGIIDVVFLSKYEGNIRYLFPFDENGLFYPTYTYVTKFENNKVVEEYMVENSQIVYQHYFNETKDKVDFYLINYVPTGSFPVISECKGIYYFNPLRFETLYYKTWIDEMKERANSKT